MSDLLEEPDGRLSLNFDEWTISLSTDQGHLTVHKAGLIVVVPIPSAAVLESLSDLAAVGQWKRRAHELNAAPLDYRDTIQGASK